LEIDFRTKIVVYFKAKCPPAIENFAGLTFEIFSNFGGPAGPVNDFNNHGFIASHILAPIPIIGPKKFPKLVEI